jgi:hypothetical protein
MDTDWRSKTHAAVEAAASEGGFAAEVRDLLKEVLADVEIAEDASFSFPIRYLAIRPWLAGIECNSIN